MKSILFYIPKFTCWNRLSITVLFIILSSGCFPYLTHERSKAIVEGVDIDQTLEIAAKELEKDGMGSVLTLWAIRDQVITPEQAGKISELYFEYIKDMKKRFNIWHITWAISNIYRLGDDSVKTVLEAAWKDASRRAA